MNTIRTLLALALGLAPLFASAQDSLADKRQAIIKGTAPGKVVLQLPSLAASAPAAAASGGAAGAAEPARGGWFSRLPPPSGRPLNAARRLDAPDQGIGLPSDASRAASAAR
jgi:hypothetical protein